MTKAKEELGTGKMVFPLIPPKRPIPGQPFRPLRAQRFPEPHFLRPGEPSTPSPKKRMTPTNLLRPRLLRNRQETPLLLAAYLLAP